MPSSIVLDSFALLAFLKKEPGSAEIVELFDRAANDEVELAASVVNLAEVWYQLARTQSEQVADEKMVELIHLGLQIVDADWPLARQAAQYKARGGISLADCFAAALAKIRDTALVTGDPEFETLKKEIKIQWMERK